MAAEWVAKATFERRADAERAADRLSKDGSTVVRRGFGSVWVLASDEAEGRIAASRLRQLGSLSRPVDLRRVGFLDRWRVDQRLFGSFGAGGGAAGFGDSGSHHHHGGSGHGHGSHDGGGWGGDGGGGGGDGGG